MFGYLKCVIESTIYLIVSDKSDVIFYISALKRKNEMSNPFNLWFLLRRWVGKLLGISNNDRAEYLFSFG